MGHKLFFMVIFTAVTAGIAFLAAFSLNFLPQSFYTAIYAHLPLHARIASDLSLSKFEGHWETTFAPERLQTQLAQCEADTGTLLIVNGHVTGTLGALNRYVTVVADVNDEGELMGKTLRGQGDAAPITGTLGNNGQGGGNWADAYDCKGTYTMRKLEPVVDPFKGSVASFKGDVLLIRGSRSELPHPGKRLYVGDKIQVPVGGNAYLTIGFDAVTVAGGTTYSVTEQSE